jgi:hypothetical protein
MVRIANSGHRIWRAMVAAYKTSDLTDTSSVNRNIRTPTASIDPDAFICQQRLRRRQHLISRGRRGVLFCQQ